MNMKRSALLIALLLFAARIFAQSEYDCYAEGVRTTLPVATDFILLKCVSGTTPDEQFASLQALPLWQKLQRNQLLPFRDLTFIRIDWVNTGQEVQALLQQVRQHPLVEYAHPFLVSPFGKLMSYDELFTVVLKQTADLSLLQEMAGQYHLELLKHHRLDDKLWFVRTTTATPMDLLALCNALQESGHFASVEPDFLLFTNLLTAGKTDKNHLAEAVAPPNDPLYPQQWHLENTGAYPQSPPYNTADADIDAEAAWLITTGSPTIRIAVIDDGVDFNNADLAGKLEWGYDATAGGGTSVMTSATGHGNLVAELIAAKANNNLEGVGVAYDCKIVPVKIFEVIPGSGGTTVTRNSWAADGIDWAWELGNADILNNSWGGGLPSTLISNALTRAFNSGRNGQGCLSFFAAGNSNTMPVEYPSSLSYVVSVGATNSCDFRRQPVSAPSCDGSVAWGSNYGTGLDIAAPGNLIQASSGSFDGTSAAAPIAAGIAALILSKNPTLTATQVRDYLETTCEKVGGYIYNSNVSGQPNGTWSTDLGYGRVNANLALAAVPSPPTTDAGISAITLPVSDCGLGASESVAVEVKNYGSASISNIPVEYRIDFNGGGFGAWTSGGSYTASLAMLEEGIVTFNINAYQEGTYVIEVRTQLSGDAVPGNDVASYTFVHRKTISSFPWTEDFEADGGGWYPSDANNPFLHTTALTGNNFINTVGSGSKAWLTTDPENPAGYFPAQTLTYLYSPCFDFSGMTNDPMFSFLFIHQLEQITAGAAEDYVSLEMSTDDGQSWNTVGSQNSGTNWYNEPEGWAETSTAGPGNWLEAVHVLSGAAGFSSVQFRFKFDSDYDNPFEDGFGLDKMQIWEPTTHDASVQSILTPSDGCALSGAESVEIKIVNRGATTITSCPVEYRYAINGGGFTAWLSAGSFSGTLLSGAETLYSFTADFSAKGIYDLEVRTQLSGDGEPVNDVANKSFEHYNPISTFPYAESFEMGKGLWLEGGFNYSWNLGAPLGNNISTASDGTQAWVTNLSGPPNDGEQSYVQSPCFDFTGLTNPQLNLDVWWDSPTDGDGARIEYSTDNGQNWSVLGVYNDPNNWYNRQFVSGLNSESGWSGYATDGSGGWLTASRALSGLSGQANVIFRVYFGEDPFSTPNATLDGFAFDNIIIAEGGSEDAGISAINTPVPFGCSLSSNEQVEVVIKNFGNTSITSIPVEYRTDYAGAGFGPWTAAGTYAGTITAGNTATFSFAADFSGQGSYVLEVRTTLPTDANNTNDAASKTIENIIASVSTFPYYQDFEMGPGNWQIRGTAPSWQAGIPAGAIINTAAGGDQVCATNLTGNYNDNEFSYLVSPCLDLSGMMSGIISFDVWYETEADKDGLKLQYSVTGGENWVTETFHTNPYNSSNIASHAGLDTPEGWSGSSGRWLHAQAYISPLGGTDVLYRFVFASDGANTGEGVAIDNICLIDLDANSTAYFGGCDTLVLYGVSGYETYYFLDPFGHYAGSIYPNGNDLGDVTLEVNDMMNVPSDDNGNFYLPRYFNLECSGPDCAGGGNFPQGNVTVGLYFESQELADYNTVAGLNAQAADLYATHYDGTAENCSLDDNDTNGTYTLINSANITASTVNSGQGFKLEMDLPNFSEIGTHATNSVLVPLPVTWLEFTGKVLDEDQSILLNWSTATESESDYFEVQRSSDGQTFSSIGRVQAAGTSYDTRKYAFLDARPLPGKNYYRLKQVDFSGIFAFSPLIVLSLPKIGFELISVRPVPASETLHITFVQRHPAVLELVLYDLYGKAVRQKSLKVIPGEQILSLDVSHLPKGLYTLRILAQRQVLAYRKITVIAP